LTKSLDDSVWCGTAVAPGERAHVSLNISESYSATPVSIPLEIWRGPEAGPTVAVTAAIHGDEINGTGTIRKIMRERPFKILRGTLVLVPVVNILGFERHTRYLPDRRDLNRAFPGSKSGSLASRMANSFFDSVIRRCDYCIDLHTAALRRTNFPNVRANLSDERLAAFARAFGAELLVDSKGPRGSLRSTACRNGCATLILEAGEVWKVEPTVVEYATRGIRNCLQFLGMVEGSPVKPAYRIETDTTKWVRAKHGGFLEFHVAPGDIVDTGDAIATNTDLVGESQNTIFSPRNGIVLGMTTIPSVAPGDPVCHLAFPKERALKKAGKAVGAMSSASLHERVRDDIASSLLVQPSNDDA